MEVNRVEAYSLLEFMLLVEKEILNGYRVCTSNENYPQNFGSFYSCGLVKEAVGAKEEPRVVKLEEPVVEQPKVKPARKQVAK